MFFQQYEKFLSFIVPDDAVPKARAQVTRFGTYTPKKTRDYEARVACLAQISMNMRPASILPISVNIIFTRSIPESWSSAKKGAALCGDFPPTGRPDLDNMMKSITDGMNHIVYTDDSQIVDMRISKRYGIKAQTDVEVWQMFKTWFPKRN